MSTSILSMTDIIDVLCLWHTSCWVVGKPQTGDIIHLTDGTMGKSHRGSRRKRVCCLVLNWHLVNLLRKTQPTGYSFVASLAFWPTSAVEHHKALLFDQLVQRGTLQNNSFFPQNDQASKSSMFWFSLFPSSFLVGFFFPSPFLFSFHVPVLFQGSLVFFLF